MVRYCKKTGWLFLIQAAILFGLPFLFVLFKEMALMAAALLVLIPAGLAAVSFWYGKNCGFSLFPAAGAFIFFGLSLFLFYNETAFEYAWIYAGLCLIITAAGAFKKSLHALAGFKKPHRRWKSAFSGRNSRSAGKQ